MTGKLLTGQVSSQNGRDGEPRVTRWRAVDEGGEEEEEEEEKSGEGRRAEKWSPEHEQGRKNRRSAATTLIKRARG